MQGRAPPVVKGVDLVPCLDKAEDPLQEQRDVPWDRRRKETTVRVRPRVGLAGVSHLNKTIVCSGMERRVRSL